MAIIYQDGQAGKVCSKCKTWRIVERFRKRLLSLDGYNSLCRECENAKTREWRTNNKDRVRELNQQYYEANREERKAYHRQYRRDHPEYFQEKMDEFREQNPSYHRDYMREWLRDNPDKRREKDFNRRARKKGNGGSFTVQEWEKLKQFYNYTCLRCGRSEPDTKLTVDHIVPLSKGGRNSIDNIQPLCLPCNCSKHDNTIDFRQYWE